MTIDTPYLDLNLPVPDVDAGWGNTLNTAFGEIDSVFAWNGTGTKVGLNVGTDRTLTLAGTMVIGGGDNSASPTAAVIRGAAVSDTQTNKIGPDITFTAGNGTGTGGSGTFNFQTAPPFASTSASRNIMQTVFRIRKMTSDYLIDAGSGGTNIANQRATMRLNGPTGGTAPQGGGAAYYIDNADVDNGAFGNFSAITRNSDAYSAAMTVWGRNGIRFMTGVAVDGDAGPKKVNERVRINDNGAIGFYNATTDTVDYGSAGATLVSNGGALPPSWSGGGGGAQGWSNVTTYVVSSSVASITINNLGTYRALRLTLTNVRPVSATGPSFQLTVSPTSTGNLYYGQVNLLGTGGTATIANNGTSQFTIATNVGNGTGEGGVTGTITLTNFAIARRTAIFSDLMYGPNGSGATGWRWANGAAFTSNQDILTSVTLKFSADAITSGQVAVEGLT